MTCNASAKPILFNRKMVAAIRSGQKTYTRRIIKPQPDDAEIICMKSVKIPYQTGQILYVRETFYQHGYWAKNGYSCTGKQKITFIASPDKPVYFPDALPAEISPCFGDRTQIGYYKRPSLFMPASAARIFLRITGARIENLRRIDNTGAEREGAQAQLPEKTARMDFADIWDSTIKKSDLAQYGWAADPWVYVYDFKVVNAYDKL